MANVQLEGVNLGWSAFLETHTSEFIAKLEIPKLETGKLLPLTDIFYAFWKVYSKNWVGKVKEINENHVFPSSTFSHLLNF